MVGPAPAVAHVRSGVRDLLEHQQRRGLLGVGDLVLVACSGGPDSIALASQTAFLAPRMDLHAGAVVVDHSIRPESAATADAAAATCAALGLDPVILRRVPAGTAPTEGAAREVRYAELDAAREASGAVGILLGHTLDDQAESVLLALGRGSGTRSIAAMAAERDAYWRPLLDVRRDDTHAACAALGLPYDVDESNTADGPWQRADGGPPPRAAIRDEVLPALQRALGRDPAPALARTASLARADADLLDDLADQAWQRCARADSPEVSGAVVLDCEALAAEPPALQARLLHRAALRAGATPGDLMHTHVLALRALVTDWHGQGVLDLPGGATGRRAYGRLVLASPS